MQTKAGGSGAGRRHLKEKSQRRLADDKEK